MPQRSLPACVILIMSTIIVSAAYGASAAGAPGGYGGPRLPLVAASAPPAATLPQRPAATGERQCAAGSPSVATLQPWAQRRLAPARIWPLTTGEGVLVAVLDSGVSRQSTPLAGALSGGVNVAGTARPDSDCAGHGTFAAGIIAARPQPGSAFVGLAPGVRIMPVRVTDDDGKASATTLAAGIRAAADAGARVIHVSMSTPSPSGQLHDAVRHAAERGALVVAAAPDSDRDGAGAGYPAAYPEALAVGAMQVDGLRARSSAAGAVGVVAPGVDVVSVGVSGPGHYVDSGNGFAAAFVSAAAALVFAYLPQLTPAQVAQRIKATADRPGRTVPDSEVGYGVVDAYAAVSALLPQEWSAAGGPVAAPASPQVRLPAPADPRPATSAFLVAGGAIALVALASLAAAARRRRRTPAGAHQDAAGEGIGREAGQPVVASPR